MSCGISCSRISNNVRLRTVNHLPVAQLHCFQGWSIRKSCAISLVLRCMLFIAWGRLSTWPAFLSIVSDGRFLTGTGNNRNKTNKYRKKCHIPNLISWTRYVQRYTTVLPNLIYICLISLQQGVTFTNMKPQKVTIRNIMQAFWKRLPIFESQISLSKENPSLRIYHACLMVFCAATFHMKPPVNKCFCYRFVKQEKRNNFQQHNNATQFYIKLYILFNKCY